MSLILLGILNSQVTGGGAGAYDLLETQILTSSASSVTFSSIPQDYKHLQIRAVIRDTNDFAAGNIRNTRITFNGDSSTNYRGHQLVGEGSVVFSSDMGSTINPRGSIDDTAPAGIYVPAVIDILDYSSTTKNTTLRHFAGTVKGDGSGQFVGLVSGLFISTAAVTSVTIGSAVSHKTGSRFSLYGVK